MIESTARLSRRFVLPAALLALSACAAPSEVPSGSGAKDGAAPVHAAAAPASASASAGPDKVKLASNIRRFFESEGQIPADVKLEVGEVKPSELPGLWDIQLNLSRGEQAQTLDFLASGDGRWLLKKELIDLSIDPIATVIGKIKIGDADPSRGPKDAKVTIVEYSDYQCPYCAKANEILDGQVLKEFGDKVRFVYKQFPLEMHKWAEPASLVGLCVNKTAGSDAFWKYHNTVFAKAEDIDDTTATETLLSIAKDSGADQAKVKDCLDKGEMKAVIVASKAEADSLGVNSTPTFFVNGRRLSGALPLESFKAIIEPELQKAG